LTSSAVVASPGSATVYSAAARSAEVAMASMPLRQAPFDLYCLRDASVGCMILPSNDRDLRGWRVVWGELIWRVLLVWS
jgi:hypothetical protein